MKKRLLRVAIILLALLVMCGYIWLNILEHANPYYGQWVMFEPESLDELIDESSYILEVRFIGEHDNFDGPLEEYFDTEVLEVVKGKRQLLNQTIVVNSDYITLDENETYLIFATKIRKAYYLTGREKGIYRRTNAGYLSQYNKEHANIPEVLNLETILDKIN